VLSAVLLMVRCGLSAAAVVIASRNLWYCHHPKIVRGTGPHGALAALFVRRHQLSKLRKMQQMAALRALLQMAKCKRRHVAVATAGPSPSLSSVCNSSRIASAPGVVGVVAAQHARRRQRTVCSSQQPTVVLHALLQMVLCRSSLALVANASPLHRIVLGPGVLGAVVAQHARKRRHTKCSNKLPMVVRHALLPMALCSHNLVAVESASQHPKTAGVHGANGAVAAHRARRHQCTTYNSRLQTVARLALLQMVLCNRGRAAVAAATQRLKIAQAHGAIGAAAAQPAHKQQLTV
jgi:hypothetical protein